MLLSLSLLLLLMLLLLSESASTHIEVKSLSYCAISRCSRKSSSTMARSFLLVVLASVLAAVTAFVNNGITQR